MFLPADRPRAASFDGALQALDRQRIFGADIDEALSRADGVGADDQPSSIVWGSPSIGCGP